jgi:hypothetical protein
VRSAFLVVALPMMLLVVGGCQYAFKGNSRPPASERLDDYTNQGPFPVHGVSSKAPGPRLFQQVLQSRQLRAFLTSQKNPDTLEVLGEEGGDLEIVLVYSRPSNPPARRIRVERTAGRLSAYPPTKLDGSPLGSGRPPGGSGESREEKARERAPVAIDDPRNDPPAVEIPMPTEIQNLECPIDPDRPDCQGLCVPGSPYEWCL